MKIYECHTQSFEEISYPGIELVIVGDTYRPSDDSYVLLEACIDVLMSFAKGFVHGVEIGCGSGFITIELTRRGFLSYAIAIDISPCAVKSTYINVRKHGLDALIDVVQSHSAACIRSKSIDVAFFNPPYIPTSNDSVEHPSWSGGSEGIEIAIDFLNEAVRIAKKSIVFVFSSLQNLTKLFEYAQHRCTEGIEILGDTCRFFFLRNIV